MFDISKAQLRSLSDVEVRELVARLCEAELLDEGIPARSVRWGGSQTAPDRGLDVDCVVETNDFSGDFVPRPRTGFQVKKSKMPASAIRKEMSPKGQLRPIFRELAEHNGCYVIVSLQDDPTGNAAASRRDEMRRQIEPTRAYGDLRTEFFGCNELASWLRQHPGVQLWVRERLCVPLFGWKPFARWTHTPTGVPDDLICDKGVTIILPGKTGKRLDLVQGIDGIRNCFKGSSNALRIVGLSGIGKTRIVQALFEDTVGSDPLNRSLAIYGDIGGETIPSARELLERLAVESRPAIVILDNCPSTTHNLLAKEVSSIPHLRLITVEYDIREDTPEATSVVRIEADGPDMAEALVKRRYPNHGSVNARRIAQFAGGNARIALALAARVTEGESLSALSDAQLFERLFYQRNVVDANLLDAAEILALVYSFSVASDQDGIDELNTLASLLGRDRRQLYRATQQLLERQLAQSRGPWRAVLPQAIADHLASSALRNIPVDDILHAFQPLPNSRLLRSFGKRLGFLHKHPVARSMVQSWMSPQGLLHDVAHLEKDFLQLLENVAPAAPEAVLAALEEQEISQFTKGSPWEHEPARTVTKLLCLIAYDQPFFERSIDLLVKFALAEKHSDHHNGAGGFLPGLFSLYLSGTEASPEVREQVVRRFLLSQDHHERDLGLEMLDAALQSEHWSSTAPFEFGARSRGYGYTPQTADDETSWFERFLALGEAAATEVESNHSRRVRELLAHNFGALWRYKALRPFLTRMARSLNDRRPWPEGWQAVRSIKYYDYGGTDDQECGPDWHRLEELDQILRPTELADEVRTFVLSPLHTQVTFGDEEELRDDQRWQVARQQAAARAYDIGRIVGAEPEALTEISEELFASEPEFYRQFGEGMATECNDPSALWERLVGWFTVAGNNARQWQLLCGVVTGLHQREESIAQKILDEAVQNVALRRIIVDLQMSVPIDHVGAGRMRRALDFEDTPLAQFGNLAWSHPLDALREDDLRDLLLRLLDRPRGSRVVIDGLSMRLFSLTNDGKSLSPGLKKVALLAATKMFGEKGDSYDGGMTDHRLSEILKDCMDETEFPAETAALLDAYFLRLKESNGYIGGIEDAIAVLAEKATAHFLQGALLDPGIEDSVRRSIFKKSLKKNPLRNIDPHKLLEWCRSGDIQARLVLVAQAIYPFEEHSDGDLVVFSAQAFSILNESTEPFKVLGHFSSSVYPSAWSGSRAEIIAKRCRPFEALLDHGQKEIREAAAACVSRIKVYEKQERERERAEDQQREQRFE